MPEEMKDLTYLVDCWDALAKEEWAYFFMRGCEGHNTGRSVSPIYKNDPSAQHWWLIGNEYMSTVDLMDHKEIFQGAFCRAFLSGKKPVNSHSTYSSALGVEARIHYETMWGVLKPQKGDSVMAEKTTTQNTLYKVKGQDVYGIIVGTDSQRRSILEIRGENGKLLPFNPDDIEEVMPYTISVRSSDGNGSMIADEGIYNVGDVLLVAGDTYPGIVEVSATNTKHRNAIVDARNVVLKVLYSRKEKKDVQEAAPVSTTGNVAGYEGQ